MAERQHRYLDIIEEAEGDDGFPVREYVGSMAAELARLARWIEDERLAEVLDEAVTLANQTPAAIPSA